jgi:hypothetical protein
VQISVLVLGVLGASVGCLASFFGMSYTDIYAQKWPALGASTGVCLAGLLGVFLASSRPRVAAVLLLVAAAWLFGEAVVFSEHVSYVTIGLVSPGDRDYAAVRIQARDAYERHLYLSTLPLGASATLLVITAGLTLLQRTPQAKGSSAPPSKSTPAST